MIVGGGGRESVFADGLAEDCRLFAALPHENPSVVRGVRRSGGAFAVGNADDADFVVACARQWRPELVFVNADAPLANGVVDALRADGVCAIGATRAAARVEWDKVFAMRLMRELCPEMTPFYRVAASGAEVAAALKEFSARGREVVVKPQGLTGGKGVRVMGRHFAGYDEAARYAGGLLAAGDAAVLLVERLVGEEFTLMGICDGENLAFAPATYDYPYRFEGDGGAGTGGMGSFCAADGGLPFLSEAHVAVCAEAMRRVVGRLRDSGAALEGVLNGGFFLTAEGIRFMEFNSRFGDPEALCVLPLLETPLLEVLGAIRDRRVAAERVRFAARAAVVKYLVAHEYPEASPRAVEFSVDEEAVAEAGGRVFFGSCVAGEEEGRFWTLRRSRVMAVMALGESVPAAAARVEAAIGRCVRGGLEWRRDIGSAAEMRRLEEWARKTGEAGRG